jgi:GDP-L-fucose synthase
MDTSAKVFVAGHRGLVGSALVRELSRQGVANLVLRPRESLDLLVQRDVERFFQEERPDVVFLAAAKVGGIIANSTRPAEFIFANLAMQTHVIHESWRAGVRTLLFLGSSCIYPRDTPNPIREECLLTGKLEETNEPYAVAKIAGIKMCEAYSRQYGCDFRCVMPTNLFGPGDNYDLTSSHVLPALIRKCHLAKLAELEDFDSIQRDEQLRGPIPDSTLQALGLTRSGASLRGAASAGIQIEIWGSGRPQREMLLVDDLAEACRMVCALPRSEYERACTDAEGSNVGFLNVGSGEQRSIAEIATRVRDIVGARSRLKFDASKPDGTPQKLIDSSRIRSLGWRPRHSFDEGVEIAYADYRSGAQRALG